MTVAAIVAALVALACSVALLLVVMALVWWLDRYDREPVHLVALVFAWGMAAAPLLALTGELASGGMLRWLHGAAAGDLLNLILAGPAVEELAKAIAVVAVVALSRQFDNPTDGIVYGTAVGLGFAVTENALYAAAALSAGQGSHDLAGLILARTLFTAGIHALSSAAFGGFLGFAYLSRRWAARLVWTAAGAVCAVVLHGLWNASLVWLRVEGGGSSLWVLGIVPLYALYLLVLALFLSGEHRILLRELQEEVEWGTLPGWVVEVIPYYRRRLRADWWPSRQERTVIARLLTRLAFRKHSLAHMPVEEARVAAIEVMHLRRQVGAILAPAPREADVEMSSDAFRIR